jgi:phosphoglycolate phosphatase
MKKARHHWFFDFDGTLARTGEDIILAWKKTIADMGLSCPHFDEVFRIGPTLEKMAYELFGDASVELVAELGERFKPNYDESGFPNTISYPGIPEKLAALKESGAKIYVVTNKRHVATQKIVKALGWENLFDGVWSFDSFPGVKYKKPELLARLLADLGVDPSDAVMVGDTKGDIDAGKANGVRTIGVTWGYGTREELSEADELCEPN